MSPEFLLTSLVIVATPGTGVLYTITAGLARGTRASLIAAFACKLGIIPHVLAAITGLAALLHASALAFGVIKYAGVAYLLYLAWVTFRDRGALSADAESTPQTTWRVVRSGVLVNLLNPKLSIFFFAFLPLFVGGSSANTVIRMVELSGIFMLLTLVVFAGYGVCAAAVRRYVITRPRVITWVRRVFAGSFVVLAGRLAVTEARP